MELSLNERNELVENYLPLANKIAWQKHKETPRNIDIDELKSAAYMGLVDASRKFDPDKCSSFGLYARLRITGEIQDYLRSMNWGTRSNPASCCEFEAEIEHYDSNEFESLDFFHNLIKSLNPVSKQVIILYYQDGLKLKEIAAKLSLSVGRISQILNESLNLLKIEMAA